MGIQAGINVQRLDFDISCAGQPFGLTNDLLGVFLHLRKKLIEVVGRQIAHLEIKAAQVRHDVQSLAPRNLSDVHGAVRYVVI
ncbi:hypothetical protein D3C75_582040 [compost metagenome]